MPSNFKKIFFQASRSWPAFIISWAIVAFGQPSWLPFLGPVAAICGYAFFWKTLEDLNKSERFWRATLWFACVELIHLSWMTSIDYQGIYILFSYAAIALWMGAQFGCIALLISKPFNFVKALGVASLWTLIEWGRLHILCGFSFNPAGLALTSYQPSMQFAALFGVLGLSFWVMLVNGALFAARSLKGKVLGGVLALVPYVFGIIHVAYQEKEFERTQKNLHPLTVALVQPGLLPSEKIPLEQHAYDFISPWEQWKNILGYLKEQGKESFDLIILPEAVVPFSSGACLYAFEDAAQMLARELGPGVWKHLPPLEPPFSNGIKVSNAFWAQAIANYYRAELIAGMDEEDQIDKKYYSAAFHFIPGSNKVGRYEKQVLVPLAEYLPFEWCRPLVAYYGIVEFFTPGREAKVFTHKIPLSISICYEETFSNLIRQGRAKGAELFVNVTNDNWYPDSRLARQHFDHGRLRAVENGVPLLRACNSGITAAVDSLGRVAFTMDEKKKGALSFELIPYTYSTLYTFWGDKAIIALSLICLVGSFLAQRKFLSLAQNENLG